ncbi:MAG TPA: chaperone modulator CbpM [Alphaproteobacteria bacterium]|jgi:chaperone modulatory protein CbpM|nr:chaperone modulator CbpM [Alphaproteobacteria bacterium]
MLKLAELLAAIEGLSAERVTLWIAQGFVVPEQVEGEPRFAEIDVARVRLIHELERDLALDDEAVALLLSLLDQVYTLRSRLRLLNEAISGQPPEVRDAIIAALGGNPGTGDGE